MNTELTPRLSRITIYPFKSLDGVDAAESRVLDSGALEFDRRWALVDAAGKIFNAKRSPLFHRLQAAFDLAAMKISLNMRGRDERYTFSLTNELVELQTWFGQVFRLSLRVVEAAERGFPDDDESPGPTLISTATLAAVADWFPGLTLDETRRRFRCNLEIDAHQPFWEDRLFGGPEETIPFRVGGVAFRGVNPCQRCAVPTRCTETGEPDPDFIPRFRDRREATLPATTDRRRFTHFYRLSVNTRPDFAAGTSGRVVRVGDLIR